jgi:hypothetical protein
MKIKTLNKKLVLKKETISILTNNELEIVKGGVTNRSYCETNCFTCEGGFRIIC